MVAWKRNIPICCLYLITTKYVFPLHPLDIFDRVTIYIRNNMFQSALDIFGWFFGNIYFEMIYFRILKIFLSLDIFGRLFGRVTATRPPFGLISQCCRQRSWFYTYCLAKLLAVYALIYSSSWFYTYCLVKLLVVYALIYPSSWFYTYCLAKLLVVYALIYSFSWWTCSLLYIDNLVSSFTRV